MNHQQVFDFVAGHLLQQYSQCCEVSGTFRLKQNGMSCSYGCLIPDDKYTKFMELWDLPQVVELIRSTHGIDKKEVPDSFFYSMAGIHELYTPTKWRVLLFWYAKRNKLDFSLHL
jgi:hypothetical protein